MKIVWIVLFAVTLGFTARATPLDDKIKSFANALKTSLAAKNSVAPMMAGRIPALAEGLENSEETPGGEASLDAIVRQLMITDSSPTVQAAGKALLDELAAQKKARLEEQTTRISSVLGRVPAILLKAEKPSELDDILGDLQKVEMPQNGPYGYDTDTQVLAARVTSAYQFVAQWQDFLSDRDSGNFQGAQAALQSLSNFRAAGDSTFVPRSEILARAAALQGKIAPVDRNFAGSAAAPVTPEIDEDAILKGVKTLDDMEPALKALQAAKGSQAYAAGYTASHLSKMVEIYAGVKNGLPATFDFSSVNYTGGQPAPGLARIKSMLILYLFPRYLGPAAPVPNPGEAVSDYLQRTIDAAEAKEDWLLLQRTIMAETRINETQVNASGTQNFLAGLNQEMAGQLPLAVTSYENALRQPDDYLPAKVVGDRLAAIKKDHPADFDAGVKAFQNPPAPVYMNPYMMRGGYPPGFTMPGMPGYPNPAAARTAPTPASPDAPAAAPSATNAPPVAPATK